MHVFLFITLPGQNSSCNSLGHNIESFESFLDNFGYNFPHKQELILTCICVFVSYICGLVRENGVENITQT